MTQNPFWLLLGVFFSGMILGEGVWSKSVGTTSETEKGFKPESILLKTAVFGRNGNVRSLLKQGAQDLNCGQAVNYDAWVVHRLSKGEELTASTGVALAKNLTALLVGKCFRAIEINVEPMPTPPGWLVDFLRAIRKELPAKWAVRLAVPMLTSENIPGPHWTAEQLQSVLDVTDGVDIMAYDTGAKSPQEYQLWLTSAVTQASQLLAKNPRKEIWIGLPAYYDRTPLHRSSAESSTVAVEAILKLPPVTACNPRLGFAFYALWTMTESDRTMATNLRRWRDHGCHK